MAHLADLGVLPVNTEATEDSESGLNVNTPANNGEFVANGGTNEDLEGRLNLNPRAQPIGTRVYRDRLKNS